MCSGGGIFICIGIWVTETNPWNEIKKVGEPHLSVQEIAFTFNFCRENEILQLTDGQMDKRTDNRWPEANIVRSRSEFAHWSVRLSVNCSNCL